MQSNDRLWRTLIRVEEVSSNNHIVYVIIPAWHPTQRIPLGIQELPVGLRHNLKSGLRLHAKVNIGAENYNELYFWDWKIK